MTATKQKHESVRDLFLKATESAKWGTIDELISAIDEVPEIWARVASSDITTSWKKAQARRLIKTLKNDDGEPLYASIVQTDENGNEIRVYKQETLFDINDYMQAATYHGKMVIHHAKEASRYSKGYQQKTGKQFHLPFDESAILLD